MKLALLILSVLLASGPAHALNVQLESCREGYPLAPLVRDALNHALGFEYVRHPLDDWEREGSAICAQGVVLDKDKYRNHLVYLQIEVRDREGALQAVTPLYFLAASVQAHHNNVRRPWTVMSWKTVSAHLKHTIPTQWQSIDDLPSPLDPNFVTTTKRRPWGHDIDRNTFAVMDLSWLTGREGLYLATWLELLPNTNGSFYTQMYAPRTVWLERRPQGGYRVARGSGFAELLTPFSRFLAESAQLDDGTGEGRADALKKLSALPVEELQVAGEVPASSMQRILGPRQGTKR